MLIIAIKAALGLAIVPLAMTFYVASADGLKTARWFRRWIWNWAFLFLFLALCVGIALEAWSYGKQPTRSANDRYTLRFMPREAYEKELESIQQKPADWAQREQELIRKFQFAAYAYDRQDYEKAISALSELEKGRDTQGPLFQVSSYVVANNLACAYFKHARNRGFWASRYIILAQSRVPPNSTEAQAVEENFSALENLVNSLD